MFKVGQKIKITQDYKKFKANKFSWNSDMLKYMGNIDYITEIDRERGIIYLKNIPYHWDNNTLEQVLF